MTTIRFSRQELEGFASLSGDVNPLHTNADYARATHFGQPLVYGMLGAIRALSHSERSSGHPWDTLDLEFRGAIVEGVDYTLEDAGGPAGTITLRSAEATQLIAQTSSGSTAPVIDAGWLPGSLPLRRKATRRDLEELHPGLQVVGSYGASPTDASLRDRVLALCSYVIGMELPGERALFTRAKITLVPGLVAAGALAFRALLTRVDRQFRIVDVRVEIAAVDGTPVGVAELRAYVRFSPALLLPTFRQPAGTTAATLKGKVAIVTGGTRGLGAEISAAFAMAGCRVYASYRSDRTRAEAFGNAVRAAGGDLILLEGDAGDAGWNDDLRQTIESADGKLDFLVLNACEPPTAMPLDRAHGAAFSRYIADNLALVQAPAAAMLPLLRAAGGSIVAISSSFVTERPQGFAHYVALKQAVEATVQAAAGEAAGVRALIVRPPRLLTTWNDTPAGVLGAIAPERVANQLVAAVASGPLERSTVLSEFPSLPSVDVPSGHAHDFSIALIASFTAEPIVPGLRFWFGELGIGGDVEVAPYGQVLQTLLSPSGGLTRRPGLHVVLLRVQDWLRELNDSQAADEEFVRDFLGTAVRDLESALKTHRSQATSETLLILCPSFAAAAIPSAPIVSSAESELQARLSGVPGLTVVNARAWHQTYDVDETTIFDSVREYIAHIPYQAEYFHVLAAVAMRHVHQKLTPARKVVVVDCDNTLWRGVVGELGADGIQFDAAELALHQTLVRLSAGGVLIGLCSKNEEPDVWSVFEGRPDFGLKRDQVVSAMINWLPKSQNLRAMASRLNLGLDSFVFIDDNPVECAEVRAACPEVLTLEWPQDPVRAQQLLRHTWELDSRATTAEDLRRSELYKEEFRRQELQAETLTFKDFIAGLELVVDIDPLSAADIARASQLTLRTNQFNFTTRRRTESELQALSSAPGYQIRTVRVRDRFGDYGLVGLLIVQITPGEMVVDTLLLSCRVLGRGVEHHLINELARIAAADGRSTIRVRVETTKRNTPARAFLERIVPPECLVSAGSDVLEASVPSEWAAQVRFEAPEHADSQVADDARPAATGDPADASRIRDREAQIERTAYSLSSGTRLVAAAGGSPQLPAAPLTDQGDAAAFVEKAFATALGLDAARIREIDSLDALGCDSFRIVEITVGLLQQFPWLPATLLFEHRSVSEIVAEIRRLSTQEPAGRISSSATERSVQTAQGDGDIAVVGMHLRCAGAASADELWQLLSSGSVAVRPVPSDRPDFFGRLNDERPHYAGLLTDVDGFEPEMFGITPREAELMDPQLRLFLEVAWGALEDAGALGSDFDPDTGVFAGVMYSDYAHRANVVARRGDNPFKSWEGFSLANRLSQIFGFHGPSLAVDTACSSSGTALHLACRALKAGDCNVAVVGGVNLILDPDRFVQLGRLGILSPSGRCLAFGAEADGTVLGEGAGVVVLRPLSAALRRGDRIYGVIKASGVSTGSGTVGFTAPNPQAQAEAVRRAVHSALIDPRTISYVETHGTATALGDPIEVRGLSLAYGDRRLWDETLMVQHRCTIGSIKPNIGHLEAGAGVLGLIKVMLQLQRGMLLPSVTSKQPNPHIPFEQTPFSIQRELAPWLPTEVDIDGVTSVVPRRAALNSFGVGGANAHVIVEEAPRRTEGAAEPEPPHHLLVLSARTKESLEDRLRLAAGILTSGDATLGDVCCSGSTGARHFDHRVAITATARQPMVDAIEAVLAGEEPVGASRGVLSRPAGAPRVAFLFTGQGSQYAGMGRGLYEAEPVFREAMDRCFELFKPLLEGNLQATIFAEAGSVEGELLNETALTQPALFTLGYALARLWEAWGVKPEVVLGHSVGEIAAMCVAGGISLEDAVTLIAARGRLMQALPRGGAMTSIMTAEDRVLQAIEGYEDRVAVAAINGPAQVVISGDGAAVASIAARLGAEGVRTKDLVVSHAFHSPLMRPMIADYEAVVRRIRFSSPRAAFVSCVLGRTAGTELTDASYWVRNVTDPVRFTDGIRAVDAMGITTFVEIGPQPILSGMGRQTLGEAATRAWLPSLKKDDPPHRAMLGSLGNLYVLGTEVDWRGVHARTSRPRVTLPAYPFARRRFWINWEESADAAPSSDAAAAASPRGGAKTYALVWREAPALTGHDLAAARWVIVGARNDGLVESLSRSLEAAGAETSVVPAAADLPGAIAEVAGVIYVPGDQMNDSPGEYAIDAAETVRSIARTLIDATSQLARRLFIVTRRAVSVDATPGSPINPGAAALWGAGRTIALERPEIWGGLIDVDGSAALDSDGIAKEVAGAGVEDQVVLRGDRRYVPRLVASEVAAAGESSVRPDRTYLVTGGLGALGLKVATWLVERGARSLILTGRRGMETPGAEAAIWTLESSGAQVRVVRADTAQAGDVDLALSAVPASSPLAGIFHAAGVDETRTIDALTPGDVERVMHGKVLGAWHLHSKTQDILLDHFVLFSSIASVLGSAGRFGYASANAFLDGLAEHRRRAGLPALSVNWGPWSGGGMATRVALEQYARVGNYGLRPDEGVQMLGLLANSPLSQVVVADIDWTTFRTAFEARRIRPLISELVGSVPVPPPAGRAPWIERLADVPADDRFAALAGLLRAEVAQTLGFAVVDVPPDQPFRDIGMDSLMSADFAQRLQKRIGIRGTTVVFDHPTVNQLAVHLLAAVEGQLAPTLAAPPALPDPPVTGSFSEADVMAFQRIAFPQRPEQFLSSRWRWMFLDSAARLEVQPRVWLHREAGAVVGHNGAIPVRVSIGDSEHDSAWLVDTMVLEDYRSHGVGARLMMEAHEALPFALSLGQTEQMREIQFRLGWEQVAPLEIAQLLIRPERVLQGKLPRPAAAAAALGLRATNFVRGAGRRAAGDVREIARFDAVHDALWTRMSTASLCAVKRDASYLNWKYVDQPGQAFLRLELLENGVAQGVIVCMFREPDDAYRYRRAFIVDLVAPLGNAAVLERLLRAAIQASAARGADALSCMHVSRPLTAALRACGFRLRQPERFLLVRPVGLEPALARAVVDPSAWFVTQGDSDIDRPW